MARAVAGVQAAGRGGGADPGRQRHCGTAAGRALGTVAAGRARPAAALWLCGCGRARDAERPAAGWRAGAQRVSALRSSGHAATGQGQRRPAGCGKLRATASDSARQQAARHQEAAAHYKRSN